MRYSRSRKMIAGAALVFAGFGVASVGSTAEAYPKPSPSTQIVRANLQIIICTLAPHYCGHPVP